MSATFEKPHGRVGEAGGDPQDRVDLLAVLVEETSRRRHHHDSLADLESDHAERDGIEQTDGDEASAAAVARRRGAVRAGRGP